MKALAVWQRSEAHETFRLGLQLMFASFFIAICAQIRIPLYFTPVPLTGQTFGVILIGAILGSKKGALAILFYLIEGCIGFPVWAGGRSGFHHFIGPTGGYLMSYLLQAYLVGYVTERKQRSAAKTIAAIFSCCCLQLGIGTLWLSCFVGLENVLMMGFYPFVPGEFAKTFLVTTYLKHRSKTYEN